MNTVGDYYDIYRKTDVWLMTKKVKTKRNSKRGAVRAEEIKPICLTENQPEITSLNT